MSTNTLHFVRQQNPKQSKKCGEGYLYVHLWDTGHQYLIFSSKEEASEWIKGVKAKEAA
jgi:hypothetical protein